MDIQHLHATTQALRARLQVVCPGAEVSIGDPSDPRSWRAVAPPEATPQQAENAQSLLQTLDANAARVPASVKMWQAKAALASIGKLDAANSAVASVGGSVALAWEYAPDISRHSSAVAAVGAAIGLSTAGMDALFISAAKIEV